MAAAAEGVLSVLAERLEVLFRAGLSRPRTLLVAVCLALFLPGFFALPVVDRDEARFAQASRQMEESGDLVDIRFQEGTRYKKPVGIYWLQAGAAAALPGGAIWEYRVPSLAGAVAAVLLTWRIGAVLLGPAAALGAGLVLASALVLGGEARLATTDAVLLALILGAQGALAGLWTGKGPPARLSLLFWACLGASVLVKGPIGLMVAALTALALVAAGRQARWLRPLADLRWALLFLLIVLPWYIAISARAGMAFWNEALFDDLLSKVQSGQESHGAPPGSYLAGVWLTFWPGAALLAPLIPAIWRRRKDPAVLFLLAWLLPSWIVFEIVPTKLVHYTLPLFPALALLLAAVWLGRSAAPGRGQRALAVGLALLGPAMLLGVIYVAVRFGPGGLWPALGALAPALALVLLLARTLAEARRGASVLVLVLLAAVVNAGLFGSLARIGYLWPSDRLAEVAATLTCGRPEIVSVRYTEPSAVFMLGRDIRFARAEEAAAALAGPCPMAIVAEAQAEAFIAAAADLGIAPRPLATVEGFAIGAGRSVRLAVFTRP